MRKLKPGPNYFGKMHHPAFGIRIPELFLPGIIKALKKYHSSATFMLSFGRETATQKVIDAPFGSYPITLGHTGTSITEYLSFAKKESLRAKVPIELEADHLIIIGSPERAVKRIAGVKEENEKKRLDPRKLEESFRYNFSAIDEALSSAEVAMFTLDSSDLYDYSFDGLDWTRLRRAFERELCSRRQSEILNRYGGKVFKFFCKDGSIFRLKLKDEKIMKLALKYEKSLKASFKIYDYIKEKLPEGDFGFELSMDEAPEPTALEDAFFYLNEWTASGRKLDYFAPNLGFAKRADYKGSLKKLFNSAKKLSAIANHFDGALLSIHSGSGTTPYSGKGKGVYRVLLKATGNKLKYKISGVYYELLLELLARGAGGSYGIRLFEEVFDKVLDFCIQEVKNNGKLASELLKKQLESYRLALKKGSGKPFDPRADFFRFNSYLALTFRDEKGTRKYRAQMIELYRKSKEFRKKLDQEVFALTERLIKGLKFQNNY